MLLVDVDHAGQWVDAARAAAPPNVAVQASCGAREAGAEHAFLPLYARCHALLGAGGTTASARAWLHAEVSSE